MIAPPSSEMLRYAVKNVFTRPTCIYAVALSSVQKVLVKVSAQLNKTETKSALENADKQTASNVNTTQLTTQLQANIDTEP